MSNHILLLTSVFAALLVQVCYAQQSPTSSNKSNSGNTTGSTNTQQSPAGWKRVHTFNSTTTKQATKTSSSTTQTRSASGFSRQTTGGMANSQTNAMNIQSGIFNGQASGVALASTMQGLNAANQSSLNYLMDVRLLSNVLANQMNVQFQNPLDRMVFDILVMELMRQYPVETQTLIQTLRASLGNGFSTGQGQGQMLNGNATATSRSGTNTTTQPATNGLRR